jgi:3-phenylpropionate/cinnamic acid dioxygenase small subunit
MTIDTEVSGRIQQMLLQHEVEQFLYREARLLDERRLWEWLDLLTDDVHYWMPLRSTRARGEEDEEFTRPHENSYFDDDKTLLRMRLEKLDTGFSWSEDPPSRTRHLVTNVEITPTAKDGEVQVECCLLVYRSRLGTDEDWWVGKRQDTLRRVDGEWKIVRRHIFLDQAVLRSKNLSIFF